jgi:hypothetical protein
MRAVLAHDFLFSLRNVGADGSESRPYQQAYARASEDLKSPLPRCVDGKVHTEFTEAEAAISNHALRMSKVETVAALFPSDFCGSAVLRFCCSAGRR